MRDSLDASHVALDDAKDRLLDYAAALAARDAAAPPLPALCFVGPPGVGKTSLARAFAAALGRPLARVSPHAWGPALPNGMPGALVEAVRAAGAPGPVVLVEHVDRLAADMRAAAAALGDALDPAERGGGGRVSRRGRVLAV